MVDVVVVTDEGSGVTFELEELDGSMPAERTYSFHTPESNGLIIRSRSNIPSIRHPRYSRDTREMSLESHDEFSGCGVPELDGSVGA